MSTPSESSGAPATVVCGTTLSQSAAGAVIDDIVRHHQTITAATVGGLLFVRVSETCAHGARVTWKPPSAATLVTVAKAADGLPVVVVLKPVSSRARFSISAERGHGVVAHAAVRLR